MVKVICDTNFIIHLANKRIRNLESIEIDIGPLIFLIPNVVEIELNRLKDIPTKKQEIEKTIDYIKKLSKLSINGTFADDEILKYIKENRSFVGTMDKKLKQSIKQYGSSVISFNNDYLVLES